MYTVLTVLHVIVCTFLILVVLLQAGKGGGMGIAFGGGGSQTVFGSSGAGNFLTRLTAICAIVFFSNSLLLAYLSSQSDSKRLQTIGQHKMTEKQMQEAANAKVAKDFESAQGDRKDDRARAATGCDRRRARFRRRPRRPCGRAADEAAAPAATAEAPARPETEARRRPTKSRPRRSARRSPPRRPKGEGPPGTHRRPPANPAATRARHSLETHVAASVRQGPGTRERLLGRSTCARVDQRRPWYPLPPIRSWRARCAIASSASAATACSRSCPSTPARCAHARAQQRRQRGRDVRQRHPLRRQGAVRDATRRCASPSLRSTPAPACSPARIERRRRRDRTVDRRDGRAAPDARRDPDDRPGGRALHRAADRRAGERACRSPRLDGQPARDDVRRRADADLRAPRRDLRSAHRDARVVPAPHQRRVRARAEPPGDRSRGVGARLRHHARVRHRRLRDRGRRLPRGARRPGREVPVHLLGGPLAITVAPGPGRQRSASPA